MHHRGSLAACLAALALAACASPPVERISVLFQGKGAPALSAGITQFEEGRYPEATRSLNSALEQGLSSTADLARAHKYLAFIHCVSGRVPQCREEFVRALNVSPAMELEPSEAGHPTWGPVFKSVKGRR
jgi:Tfp pilus assembly protein PilF